MKDSKKINIHLVRFTNYEVTEEDVLDYLDQCREFNDKPNVDNFLSQYMAAGSFDSFCEEVIDTEIDDSSEFDNFIEKCLKKNS